MSCLPPIPEPDYTHALHARVCQVAALRGVVPVVHVLAKRGPLVYCATIKEPYSVPNGPDCWTLQTLWPEKTRITVPVRNVIACNPAFCTCLEPVADSVGLACDGTPQAVSGSLSGEVTCM